MKRKSVEIERLSLNLDNFSDSIHRNLGKTMKLINSQLKNIMKKKEFRSTRLI